MAMFWSSDACVICASDFTRLIEGSYREFQAIGRAVWTDGPQVELSCLLGESCDSLGFDLLLLLRDKNRSVATEERTKQLDCEEHRRTNARQSFDLIQ